jgi:hypothetical protein
MVFFASEKITIFVDDFFRKYFAKSKHELAVRIAQ